MEMKVVILRRPEKVGNIVAEEEAGIMMTKTTIKGLRAVVGEILVVVKAEDGLEMKKDILRQQWKGGNIVAVEEAVIMTMTTTIKDLRAAAAEEAVTMMQMMTTTKDLRVAVVEEVVIMRKTKTIIKALRAAVVDTAVDTMRMMTIIKGLHVVVEEVRAAAKVEVGMEMKKDILKQLWKDGSIGVEEVDAAMTMMTMTIIKDLHVAVAEVYAKAEVGLAMKEDIPARPGKVGEIGINFLN
jgi:hypothetical protein